MSFASFENADEHALTRAYHHAVHTGDERALRDGMRALLRDHKQRGTPPEKMLVELKLLLPRIPLNMPGEVAANGRTMYERLISWAIETYFSGSLFD